MSSENGRRGRWVKEITQHEEMWENFLALLMLTEDMAALIEDCDELSIRCHQVLHRHPELKSLMQPALDRLEEMVKRLSQICQRYKGAPEALREWRETEAELREAGKLDK